MVTSASAAMTRQDRETAGPNRFQVGFDLRYMVMRIGLDDAYTDKARLLLIGNSRTLDRSLVSPF